MNTTDTTRRFSSHLMALTRGVGMLGIVGVTAIMHAQPAKTGSGNHTVPRAAVNKAIADWPVGPQLAIQQMMVKYGEPQEVTSARVVWRNEGPFKRITVTRQELPHNFPITHKDYLEHTISYRVPDDKLDDVHKLDASITIYRVGGELSARCDLESNNVLTLNLADDVATGRKSVDEARKAFGEAVMARTLGHPPASTMTLQFQPMTPQTAAVTEKTTIPGSPQPAAMASTGNGRDRAVGTSGTTASTDAGILAQLIALDENEVRAAMTAEQKKLDQPVAAFARMVHQAHGQNIQRTEQLAVEHDIVPVETMAADQLHMKGEEQLIKLVPLTGDAFARQFVSAMVNGHRQALQKIDQWMKEAQSSAVKQHLRDTRQHVEAHLKQAEQLQKKA